jgi:hypothetical protein
MNEMIESVAKAICEGEGFEWRLKERHVLWERLARAAIRAMREPTPEMLSSGGRTCMMSRIDARLGGT